MLDFWGVRAIWEPPPPTIQNPTPRCYSLGGFGPETQQESLRTCISATSRFRTFDAFDAL